MSTKNVQRKISAEDVQFPGYLRAPIAAKPTALGLWLHTDGLGRREVVPELIAAAIYPGEAATELVIEHLLLLEESGFLDFYTAKESGGFSCVDRSASTRASRGRTAPIRPFANLREASRLWGARERAGARVRAEQAERAGQWATWADEQESRPAPPKRPLLLDAPPIGCPDHPHGRFENCGPCGTARKRHDRWVQEARYGEQMTEFEQGNPSEGPWDEEPF